MARRHFRAERVSRPAAKRPGNEDRRFAQRTKRTGPRTDPFCTFAPREKFSDGQSSPEKRRIRHEFALYLNSMPIISRLRARNLSEALTQNEGPADVRRAFVFTPRLCALSPRRRSGGGYPRRGRCAGGARRFPRRAPRPRRAGGRRSCQARRRRRRSRAW